MVVVVMAKVMVVRMVMAKGDSSEVRAKVVMSGNLSQGGDNWSTSS